MGELNGRRDVDYILYTGELVEMFVQLTGCAAAAALFIFEQEPCCAIVNNNPLSKISRYHVRSNPMKTLGPSTPLLVTVKSATPSKGMT